MLRELAEKVFMYFFGFLLHPLSKPRFNRSMIRLETELRTSDSYWGFWLLRAAVVIDCIPVIVVALIAVVIVLIVAVVVAVTVFLRSAATRWVARLPVPLIVATAVVVERHLPSFLAKEKVGL